MSSDPSDEWPSETTEVDQVLALHEDTLQAGQTWAVVDAGWMHGYFGYLGLDLMTKAKITPAGKAPGPIDNSSITQETNRLGLKVGLAEGASYELVSLPLWKFLVAQYGLAEGTVPVLRKVVVKGLLRKTRLDLYPLFLTVYECGTDGKPEQDSRQTVAVKRSSSFEDYMASLQGLNTDEKVSSAPAPVVEEGEEEGEEGDIRIWYHADKKKQQAGHVPTAPPLITPAEDADVETAETAAAAAAVEVDVASAEDDTKEWVQLVGGDLKASLDSIAPLPGQGLLTIMVERKTEAGEWKIVVVQKNWKEFAVGDKIDALDTSNKWYESTVKKVEDARIFVHYDEWDSKWDAWIDSSDFTKLAPFGTKSTPRSRFVGSSRFGSSYGSSAKGKPEVDGLVGLNNLGNTCFMNSTLQCVSNSLPLTTFFLEDEYDHLINRTNPLGWQGKVADEFGKLIKEMWSNQYTAVAPRNFKEAIGDFAPRFKGYSQQDSSELLNFLLDGLHEDLNQVKNKPATSAVESKGRDDEIVAKEAWAVHLQRNQSVIQDIFMGQLRSRLDCPDCQRVSVTFDPFMFLSVPLPQSADHRLDIWVVYEDLSKPVTKFNVAVNKSGPIYELKEKIAELTGIDPTLQIVADVWMDKVYRFLHDTSNISEIGRMDQTYIYECSELKTHKYHEVWPVSIVSQSLRLNPVYNAESAHSKQYSTEYIGIPRVTVVPKEGDVKIADLLAVANRVAQARLTDDAQTKPASEVYQVAQLDSAGSYCGKCSYGCSGCVLDANDGDGLFERTAGRFKASFSLSIQWQDKGAGFDKETDKRVVDAEHASEDTEKPQKRKVLNIYDCMSSFVEKEILTEQNPWYCSDCKEFKCATKKMDVWNTPELLIVHMKRFQNSRTASDKISTFVDFPLNGLDMAPFVKAQKMVGQTIYDLYAVSNHMGGLGGGHYTAYGKNPINNKWYLFDDSRVSRIEGNVKETVVSSSAYVLFYQRRKPVDTSSTKTAKTD